MWVPLLVPKVAKSGTTQLEVSTSASMQEIHAPVLKSDVTYAGFWRRALAYLIDLTLLLAVQGAIATSVLIFAPYNWQALANVAPVSSAITWAYFALMESSPARGTLGKVALGLFVSDLRGDPITFRRASARYWLKILSSLLLLTGWFFAAFTPRKQALHDLLAGTLVLRRFNYFTNVPDEATKPGEFWDGSAWVKLAAPLEQR